MEDSGLGLLYLRAQYYNPGLKTFMSCDPWEGTGLRPATLNYYVYVENNPALYVDPSGHDPWWCQGGTCQSDYYGFNFNPRDLTLWLYREMMTNANDSRLQQVRSANRAADTALIAGTTMAVAGTCTAILPITVAGLVVDAGAVGVYGLAFLQFNALVGKYQTWDFKHRIESRLGEGITLCSSSDCKSKCSSSDCKSNVEYSVPGNIHFGYVAREAGYHDIVTHIGAGTAEILDSSHQPFTPDYDYDPTGKFRVYLDRNGVGLHMNVGDDPEDHDAVQFGVYLYNKYGRQFSLGQFKRELETYMGRFDTASPDDTQVPRYISSKWPYPVGYFDPTK